MKRKWRLYGLGLIIIAGACAAVMAIVSDREGGLTFDPAGMEGTGMKESWSETLTYSNWLTVMVDSREDNQNDPRRGLYYPAGDPFIMKHNGVYYLYPSTHYQHTNIRAWSSIDLINWSYEGIVAEDPGLRMAYAPEVIYWNGLFYMVTSTPSGAGHRILTSDSPTGPFTFATDNLGNGIDGSIYIDDDGDWYFFRSGSRGIRGHRMNQDELTIGPEVHLRGTDMGGHTEGPMVIKRNGIYFMTITGNHLMSHGYRVNYAISRTGPLGGYVQPYNNPIIINTDDDHHGLGHSSTFRGPDLDSYYLAYHNNKNPYGVGHDRYLNIDRLVFNGEKMDVLGPTNYPQKAPRMADFYTWLHQDGLDGWSEVPAAGSTLLLYGEQTEGSYTAEFNFRIDPERSGEGGRIGAVFSYVDTDHYGMAVAGVGDRSFQLIAVREGEQKVLATAALPGYMDFTKLHTIRVEMDKGQADVYFDGMHKLAAEMNALGAGRMGYAYEEAVLLPEYTAFSNLVHGSGDFDAYKPVPGGIEAVHYLQGEGRGYQVSVPSDSPNPYRAGDGTTIVKAEDHTYLVQLADKGDWLRYNINVKENGRYGLDLRVMDQDREAKVEVYLDDKLKGTLVIPPAAPGEQYDWVKVTGSQALQLEQDLHTLTLRLASGSLSLMSFNLYKVENEIDERYDLTQGLLAEWSYTGVWSSGERGYYTSSPDTDGLALAGSKAWTNYVIEADIEPVSLSSLGNGGLLVRASNESQHPHQVPDPVMGYYVALTGDRVILRKLNYESVKVLQQANLRLEMNKTHRFKVEAVGSTIRVFVNDSAEPLIEYTDPDAFTAGKAGFRSGRNAELYFSNMTVKSAGR